MQLPDYTGPGLKFSPPFQFSNVTVTMFPLRAQLDALQRFCDSYLNIVPPEVGYFRASMPYVYLMLLDYGKLAAQVMNLGCFSQREALFAVPIEWYKYSGGRWLFHDWATVAPFIYVDDPTSMALGRTTMGWPKTLMNLTPQLTGWIKDPDGNTTDVAISTKVFSKAYAGATLEDQMCLRISSPMTSSFRFPAQTDGPLMPWTFWSNMAKNMSDFTFDYMTTLQGAGIMPPNETFTPENLARKLDKAARAAWQSVPWAPNSTYLSLNLKQFRRADEPHKYCYQALTSGPMRYTALARGGLLGSAVGDPSGGYTIDVASWPNFPVVETLGLQADRYAIDGGPTVARLRPVFPFWYDANMEYLRTETLAFRSETGCWHDAEGQPIQSAAERKDDLYFNTTTGAASPVLTGPFLFENATLRVLPLLADRTKCQTFLNATINDPLKSLVEPRERFEVWADSTATAAYVYLVATDWGDVASETNSIGDWADASVTLYLPIKRSVNGQVVGMGLVPAYTFTNGTLHMCTLSELYGVPAVWSTIVHPAHAWQAPRSAQPRTVLRVDTEYVPSLNEGQMAETNTLLSLLEQGQPTARRQERPESNARITLDGVLSSRAQRTAVSEVALTGAQDLLTQHAVWSVYTMKQFRDVAKSDKACYQALVRIPHTVAVLQPPERIAHDMTVEIRELAVFPIADSLGLVASDVRITQGAIMRRFPVEDPFVLHANITLGNGEQLHSRVSLEWDVGRARQAAALEQNEVALEIEEPQAVIASLLEARDLNLPADAVLRTRRA